MIKPNPESMHKTFRLLIGANEDQPLPFVQKPSDLSLVHVTSALAENPSRDLCRHLGREGYLYQRRFALLPSRRNLRWLLPQVRRGEHDGLRFYVAHGRVGRIVKTLIVQARATGWQGWVRNTVVVASRERLPIEILLSEITGERQLVLALWPGTPGAFQKLTVQVMRGDGSVVGYLKMPMTVAAAERLRHEAAVVQDLGSYENLRPHIPRLIFAGMLNDRYVLFQSPVEGTSGPLRYGSLHEQFLTRLHGCRPERLPGARIVDETAKKWTGIASHMGVSWQELGRGALEIAARGLKGREILCGIQHGDFAPWNTRVNQGDLRLFDWEMASWNAPLLWDQFHFMTQTESLLKVRPGRKSVPDEREKNPNLYLLYLLNTLGQYWEEKATQDVVIRYRKEQLLRFISISNRAA